MYMDLEVEEHDLLLKITLEACNADNRALEVVFMPFLKDLRQVMDAFKIPFASTEYQNVYENIVALFVSRFVETEPPRPINHACPKAGCGACRDCEDLNR